METFVMRTAAKLVGCGLVLAIGVGGIKSNVLYRPHENRNAIYIDPDQASRVGRLALAKIQSFKDQLGNKTNQTNGPLPAKPFAAADKVEVGLQSLKSVGAELCPVRSGFENQFVVPFKNESANPTAMLCLNSTNIMTVPQMNSPVVVMTMKIHSNYATNPRATVAKTLAEASPELCKQVITPMAAYGRYMIEHTPGFPVGESADVRIRADEGIGPCDSWKPAQEP